LVDRRGLSAEEAAEGTFVVEDDRGNLEEFNNIIEARMHMGWLVQVANQDNTQVRLLKLINFHVLPKISV